MTKIEFIKNIELVYTKYNNNYLRGLVLKYLDKYTDKQLDELFDLITTEFSNNYRIAPDKAKFEEVWNKKYKNQGLRKQGKCWIDQKDNIFDNNMRQIGHYDQGRFIPQLNREMIDYILKNKELIWTPEKYLEIENNILKEKKIIMRK